MKIDTSNINLSSTHLFAQKDHMKIEQEMSFSSLFNNQYNALQSGAFVTTDSLQISNRFTSQWYESLCIGGQNAVSLKDQFIKEIQKLQQILDSVMQGLNRSSRGCCMHLSSLDRIYVNAGMQQSKMYEYQYSETRTFTHQEKEQTDFQADGVVHTADGRQIDFTFGLNLAREFFYEDQIVYSEQGYTLIDPLVINLESSAPQLAQSQFSFDLDMDGVQEDMPWLMPGTGFISLDKNEDGIINDGSELFGPSTGSGFGELSQYDLDQNNWIDENDAIFDELTIWENDEDGEMHLTKIKDAGLGAIYLASTETPFDLRGQSNDLQARVKRSGIALNEDGSVSSVQEIDWTA